MLFGIVCSGFKSVRDSRGYRLLFALRTEEFGVLNCTIYGKLGDEVSERFRKGEGMLVTGGQVIPRTVEGEAVYSMIVRAVYEPVKVEVFDVEEWLEEQVFAVAF